MIEVCVEIERALVERHHKRLHGIVAGRIIFADTNTRPERGIRLVQRRTGRVHALLRAGKVGTLFQRQPHGLRQRQRARLVGHRPGAAQGRQQRQDEEVFHLPGCVAQQLPPTPSFLRMSSIRHQRVIPD